MTTGPLKTLLDSGAKTALAKREEVEEDSIIATYDWQSSQPFTLTINLPPDERDAVVLFWASMMRDHMDFYHQLLDDTRSEANAAMKAQAGALAGKWDAFSRATKRRSRMRHGSRMLERALAAVTGRARAWAGGPTAPEATATATATAAATPAIPVETTIRTEGAAAGAVMEDGLDVVLLGQLMIATGDLKTRVLDAIRAGQWVGAVFESFVLETRLEIDYFRDALADAITPVQQVRYWTKHSKEHALLNTRLLDPSMEKPFAEQLGIASTMDRLFRWGERTCARAAAAHDWPDALECWEQAALQVLLANEQFADNLHDMRKLFRAGALSSILTDQMIVHAIREVEYGNEVLRDLVERGSLQREAVVAASTPARLWRSSLAPARAVPRASLAAVLAEQARATAEEIADEVSEAEAELERQLLGTMSASM